MLDALLLLQKRAPIDFTVCAFTVEQGKFLSSLRADGGISSRPRHRPGVIIATILRSSCWKNSRTMDATCAAGIAAARCSILCSGLGALTSLQFGHTADDVCESFLRNALFNGRISSLPAITWSREKDFRMIRPLIYVHEGFDGEVCCIDGRAGEFLVVVRSGPAPCGDPYATCWAIWKRSILICGRLYFRRWGMWKLAGCWTPGIWIWMALRRRGSRTIH